MAALTVVVVILVFLLAFEYVFDNHRLLWRFPRRTDVRVIDCGYACGARVPGRGLSRSPILSGSAGGSLVGIVGGAEVLEGGAEVGAAVGSGGVGAAVVPGGK